MNIVIGPIPFLRIVQKLEQAFGRTTDVMRLIELVSKDEFLKVRMDVISAFGVGEADAFTGQYGDDVEFGDLTDAVMDVTFSLYPEATPVDRPVSFDERREWCSQVLGAMDYAATDHGEE